MRYIIPQKLLLQLYRHNTHIGVRVSSIQQDMQFFNLYSFHKMKHVNVIVRKVIGFGITWAFLCVPVSSMLYCNGIVLLQFSYLSTLLQLLCMQLNSPDQLKITRMIYIYMFMYSHLDNAHHQYVCNSLA